MSFVSFWFNKFTSSKFIFVALLMFEFDKNFWILELVIPGLTIPTTLNFLINLLDKKIPSWPVIPEIKIVLLIIIPFYLIWNPIFYYFKLIFC